MSKDPLDLFGRRITRARKYLKKKNSRSLTLIILILTAGCFFYIQDYSFGIKVKAVREISDSGNFISKCKIACGIKRSTSSHFPIGAKIFFQEQGVGENIKEHNLSEDQSEALNINDNFCLNPKTKSPELAVMEKDLYAMVQDYPIEEMVPHIAEYDREVAALIIGIAKKESDWGKHSPSKNGQTCYNYWGYKGAGSRGLSMGYGCFASPQEGVEIVGGRIKELAGKNLNTPSKIVVWKCGSSCEATGGQAAARKWISDVSFYFNKIAVL